MRADGGPCDEIFKDGWTFGAGGCPRGPELRQEVAGFVQLVARLEGAMTQLPRVDETGHSECHFAEDLFAEKERLEQEVLAGVTRLSGHLLTLERWIDTCKKNIDKVQGDGEKLHHAPTRNCYSDAVGHLESECRQAVQDKDAVYIALEKAKAVLEVSSTRKFPGREPRKKTFAPASPGQSSVDYRRGNRRGNLGGEVESLLSLGPVDDGGSRSGGEDS